MLSTAKRSLISAHHVAPHRTCTSRHLRPRHAHAHAPPVRPAGRAAPRHATPRHAHTLDLGEESEQRQAGVSEGNWRRRHIGSEREVEETSGVSHRWFRRFLLHTYRSRLGFVQRKWFLRFFFYLHNKSTATLSNYWVVNIIKIDRNYHKCSIGAAPMHSFISRFHRRAIAFNYYEHDWLKSDEMKFSSPQSLFHQVS